MNDLQSGTPVSANNTLAHNGGRRFSVGDEVRALLGILHIQPDKATQTAFCEELSFALAE